MSFDLLFDSIVSNQVKCGPRILNEINLGNMKTSFRYRFIIMLWVFTLCDQYLILCNNFFVELSGITDDVFKFLLYLGLFRNVFCGYDRIENTQSILMNEGLLELDCSLIRNSFICKLWFTVGNI